MKKVIKIVMICFSVLGVVGCAKKAQIPKDSPEKKEEITKQDMKQGAQSELATGMEFFKEEKIPLPEEAGNIYDVRKSGDTIFIVLSEGVQKSSFIWKTEDKGKSWEKMLDLPDDLQYGLVSEALFLDDNSLLCSVKTDILKDDVDLGNIQKKYYKVNLTGEFTELSMDMANRDVGFLQYDNSFIYGTNQTDGISVFDGTTGGLKKEFDNIGGQINGFCVMNDKIITAGIDHIEMFDSGTGEAFNADEKLFDSLNSVLKNGNKNTGKQGFISRMICDAENGLLYYINADALYQYDFERSEFKEVLYGKNHRFAEEEMVLMDISTVGNRELSIITYKNNIHDLKELIKPEMYWYTYVPEGLAASN